VPEIRYIKRLEKEPDVKTQIYRLGAPGVTTASVYRLAQQFGLKGSPANGRLQEQEGTISYTEQQYVVHLYKASGAVRFIDQARWMVDDLKSNVEFDDDKAIALAEEVAKKYELVKEGEYQVLRVTRLHAGTLELETKKSEERVIDAGVVFQRVIEGVPVRGPGGKLVIYLDHQGQMTGFDRIWRGIEAVYKPVEALKKPARIEAHLTRFLTRREVARADVEDVEFGYFELGPHDAQRYLQPAYIMRLRLPVSEQESHMRSAFVVEAATNPVGTLVHYKPPRPAQPPRQ
jgi:hypothetical protein